MTAEESRQISMLITSAFEVQGKKLTKEIADKMMSELLDEKNKNHQAIFEKIEQRDKDFTEAMSNQYNKISENINDLRTDIGEIHLECVRREDVYNRGKAFLESPRLSPEAFFNTWAGKVALSGAGAVGITLIIEYLKR